MSDDHPEPVDGRYATREEVDAALSKEVPRWSELLERLHDDHPVTAEGRSITQRIAAVLAAHEWWATHVNGPSECACGASIPDHAAHVAAAIQAELRDVIPDVEVTKQLGGWDRVKVSLRGVLLTEGLVIPEPFAPHHPPTVTPWRADD